MQDDRLDHDHSLPSRIRLLHHGNQLRRFRICLELRDRNRSMDGNRRSPRRDHHALNLPPRSFQGKQTLPSAFFQAPNSGGLAAADFLVFWDRAS